MPHSVYINTILYNLYLYTLIIIYIYINIKNMTYKIISRILKAAKSLYKSPKINLRFS